MQITKSFEDLEETLEIKVDFNPETNEVDNIIHVWVVDKHRCIVSDILGLMTKYFEDQLESMIGSVDWREVYLNQRETAYAFGKLPNIAPVFQKIIDTHFPGNKTIGSTFLNKAI